MDVLYVMPSFFVLCSCGIVMLLSVTLGLCSCSLLYFVSGVAVDFVGDTWSVCI